MKLQSQIVFISVVTIFQIIATGCGEKKSSEGDGEIGDGILCEKDEDCPEGGRCVEGSCKPLKCRSDDDCGRLERCDILTQECIPILNCDEQNRDKDGDGYVSPGCIDPRTGSYGNDCDDMNSKIHPGAEEECNEIDDNCNNSVDEGLDVTTYYLDGDEDGWGAIPGGGEFQPPWVIVTTCLEEEELEELRGAKFTTISGDCNDQNPEIHPEVEEVCDGLDNDCNGRIDEVDKDGDGYYKCPGVADRDCDDNSPAVHPGAREVCNEADDNCNGLIDELVQITFYKDVDGDGYGQDAATLFACIPPEGYVETGGDCNDYNREIHPGAQEVCNEVDDDCNGIPDDGLPLLDIYPDIDGDRYASPGLAPQQNCRIPLGYTVAQDPDGNGTPDWDCNDTDATIHPAADELCDRKDNDCDGIVDRWCGYICSGSWPAVLPGDDRPDVVVADMNQDGLMEIGTGNNSGLALLAHDGRVIWSESGGANYARRAGVFADIDGSWDGSKYNLEWIMGAQSRITFFRMESDGTVTRHQNNLEVYDAGRFLARDVDSDGKVEVIVVTWGTIDRLRIFELNNSTDLLVLQNEIPFPDGTAVYTNGISTADIDMDGSSEIIFGEGYGRCDYPSDWSGRVFSFEIDGTRIQTYDTSISSLFAGNVGDLYVHDIDGDGMNEILAQVYYFRSHDPSICNPGEGWRRWTWDGRTATVEAGPDSGSVQVFRDLDGDGNPDADSYGGWRHDVDGDGDLDSISIDGSGRVIVQRREGGTLTAMPQGDYIGSGTLAYLGDLDGDGRLNALFAQAGGKVQCISFGDGTFNPWTSADGVPIEGEFVDRTNQRDNWEPNETIATSYFVKDDSKLYRGFISNPNDVDVFRIGTPHCGNAELKAPSNVNLRIRLYGNIDRNGDGNPDILDEKTVPAGSRAAVNCSATPQSTGLGRYWLEITSSDGTFSPWAPYTARLDANY